MSGNSQEGSVWSGCRPESPATSSTSGLRGSITSAEILLGQPVAETCRAAGDQRRRAGPFADLRQERPIMSKDSTSKANVKKKGKSIKEKQTAKRIKRDEQTGHSSNVPTTGR
jgi:hypothetical protein